MPGCNTDRKLAWKHRRLGALIEPAYMLFARPAYWEGLKQKGRYLHVVRTLGARHADWVFGSFTAACLWGLQVSHSSLKHVHIVVGAGSKLKNTNQVVRHRHATEPPETVLGVRATSLLQTLLDCLIDADFAEGLIVADSFLRVTHMDREDAIARLTELGQGRRGLQRALKTMSYGDARSENGGESKARAMMILGGYELPELQVELPDPLDSSRSFRADFGWLDLPRPQLGELDGFGKNAEEENGRYVTKFTAQQMMKEGRRESSLTMLGYGIVRFGMDDVNNPERLYKKLDLGGIPKGPRPKL